jgi:benzil reductase ((S)-benzoin forming)
MMHDTQTAAVLVVITGASSGIGRSLGATIPYPDAIVVGVSRRGGSIGDSLSADLSDPSAWGDVRLAVERHLARRRFDRAVLLHFAGLGAPHVPAAAADPDEYARSVILNAASGPALGQAFLAACASAAVPATVVLCSSPAAMRPMPGVTHYGAGKAGMEYWVRSVAAEADGAGAVVFAVVPHAVDTPMVREVMARGADGGPVGAVLRSVAEGPGLATADDVAREIWQLVLEGDHAGEAIAVGAVHA